MYGQFANPYSNAGVPNRMNYGYQPQFPQYRPLKGYMVTSVDEARAAQYDLDGSVTYFPSPAENKIYAKSIDMQGLPVFVEFVPKAPTPANDYGRRLERIESILKELGYDDKPLTVDANGAGQ